MRTRGTRRRPRGLRRFEPGSNPATAPTEGRLLGHRPDREGLPRGHDDEGHRPDDEPVVAERDPHGRTRNDRGREEEIRRFWLEESVALQPTNHWILITPRIRSRSRSTVTGARCTSSATTSTPRPKPRWSRPRPRRRADRRGVAGHQHGGGIDRADPEPLSEARAVKERRAAVVEERRPLSRAMIGSSEPSAACRPRSTPSCSSRSWAPRCCSSPSARSGCASSRNPTTVWRGSGRSRNEPPHGKLQSDTAHVRLLLAENVDPTSIWSGRGPTDR